MTYEMPVRGKEEPLEVCCYSGRPGKLTSEVTYAMLWVYGLKSSGELSQQSEDLNLSVPL